MAPALFPRTRDINNGSQCLDFEDHASLQCGFCGPGVILSAKALLDEIPDPTTQQIRDALSGNLCRCTGYSKMIEAIQAAARSLRDKSA